MSPTTCFLTTVDYHSIAYYSHLIPVAISILLAFFVLNKSKFSLLSKTFSLFIALFSIWLIGDTITWTQDNYHLVIASWASLDYINVLFYLAAIYFFLVFVNERDLSHWQKMILFISTIPAWWIAATGQSIHGLDQPNCEAFNSQWLINYKLIVEILVVGLILLYGFVSAIRLKERRWQILTVSIALTLFLTSFMSTEYIAGQTGIYEINLYSLFILPVFLAMIIFSITNLKIFAYKSFGTQLLIYVLLILVGSQFFFLQDATYRVLTLITFALSLFLGIVLVRNIHREEKLTTELEVANENQTALIHFITHQVKGFFTKSRNIFATLAEADSGLPQEFKDMANEGLHSDTYGVEMVQDILKVSDLKKGTIEYKKEPVDFKILVEEETEKLRGNAVQKGLALELDIKEGDYKLTGDREQLVHTVRNLVDNAIRFTSKGLVNVSLSLQDEGILFKVKDSGVGITPEDMARLFTEGGRGKESLKVNVDSTGYGLFIVKNIVLAHGGKIWAESEGTGRGSVFYIKLPRSY